MSSALTKVSLRNVAAHKLRLALTVLAVVLGTAFIAGSLMFTAMLGKTFDSAVASAFAEDDAVVRGQEQGAPVPLELRDAIGADPDVNKVNISGRTAVVVADSDRNAYQTGAGVSEVHIYYPPEDAVGSVPEVVDGSAPKAVGEAMVNAKGAAKYRIGIGDELIVVDTQATQTMKVTGLYTNELDQGMSLTLRIPEESYLEFYAAHGTVPGFSVSAKEGVDPAQLTAHLAEKFPEYEVKEGQTLADEASEEIRNALSFVSYFLIAFGLVGLLVGTFLIANTFSMIVAQRTKEFALLRALGASKSQITRSVVVEAALVGVIGSALGVLAGAGLVAVIRVVMERQGMELPGAGWGLSVAAVVVPIVVGALVTVASAWAPARRAGRVQPVEAMRSSESSTPQPLKARTLVGVALLLIGVGLAAWGVLWEDGSTGPRAGLVGGAAVSAIIGLFLAGPALSLPIVPVLGKGIGAPFGAVGSLAATNSKRNPRRASATAFALMLGVALVTAFGMLGTTMQRSVDDILEDEVTADLVMYGPQFGAFPVPGDVPGKVEEADGVGDVITYSQAPLTINGKAAYEMGPMKVSDVMNGDPGRLTVIEMVDGTSDLSDGGVVLPEAYAKEHALKVGDVVDVDSPLGSPLSQGGPVQAEVKGIFGKSNILESFVISRATAEKLVRPDQETILMVGANSDGSVDEDTLRANVEKAVKDSIIVQVRTPDEFGGEAKQLITQMLYILYALLSLAVVIAVLGIINTLTLSVIERRQEIGMLRAVGAQRRQVRTMIILESVQIAVFGALLGVLTGLALGWAFLTVLKDQGLSNIAYPWVLLAVMLVSSLVVGVVAALWPAQRAAKTPPLDAIAE
ncbi:ABC transporter permease [Corynebacterium tuscaniense]|uniref:ABC transporter permease n=1 Tax=Corynebacterium tuscaniense TaxID=302449 RepID=A0A2N6T7W7_9CORY|nr:FtsX-like permease family protein [Corynebacterium tuscaniense]PMC65426.1 ABC transporter permease [Corynebacterium tuscaniense]